MCICLVFGDKYIRCNQIYKFFKRSIKTDLYYLHSWINKNLVLCLYSFPVSRSFFLIIPSGLECTSALGGPRVLLWFLCIAFGQVCELKELWEIKSLSSCLNVIKCNFFLCSSLSFCRLQASIDKGRSNHKLINFIFFSCLSYHLGFLQLFYFFLKIFWWASLMERDWALKAWPKVNYWITVLIGTLVVLW